MHICRLGLAPIHISATAKGLQGGQYRKIWRPVSTSILEQKAHPGPRLRGGGGGGGGKRGGGGGEDSKTMTKIGDQRTRRCHNHAGILTGAM